MPLRIKSQSMTIWGLVCSTLFIVGAAFPARAETDCLKSIRGSEKAPAQADANFKCLSDKIEALQKQNEILLKALTTAPRVQFSPCHYDGHDQWSCLVDCAEGETAVAGWCGGSDDNTDWTHDPGNPFLSNRGKQFHCVMHQHTSNHPPTQMSAAAFCVRNAS